VEEDASGRFQASLAFTRQAFEQVAGWPLKMRGDFDQQLIASLSAVGPHADPCSVTVPSYVFRCGSTGAYHGQTLMRGPEDEGWYQTVPQNNQCGNHVFVSPELDEETQIVARSRKPSFHQLL
jgi:hypothetical protein